jgi:prepilin-type N-terminal cleavage/methylation domain-containing protein
MFIKARAGKRGFSLIEMLVGIGVGSVLITVIGAFSLYSGRSMAAMWNYADLGQTSRKALDTMTRDIRQVNRLVDFTPTLLSFEDADGSLLHFVYNPATKRLRRIKGSQSDILLEDCDFLSFAIFQRNPIGGTYDQYPTASPDTCKLVQVSWVCSRKILGNPRNTESVQTAKIVIRKQ